MTVSEILSELSIEEEGRAGNDAGGGAVWEWFKEVGDPAERWAASKSRAMAKADLFQGLKKGSGYQ